MRLLQSIVLFGSFFFTASGLMAQPAAGDRGAVLVELFTSEGCSSCPPADKLLRQIDGRTDDAGQLVVTVSEHVTYWNNLGWTDPFAAELFTDRQEAYAHRFGLESVYTPQMVVNGAEQFTGSDSASLLHSLTWEAQQGSPVALRIAGAELKNGRLDARYSVGGSVPSRGAELYAVIADDSDRSGVLRGENSGRTLLHVSVARAVIRVDRLRASGREERHLAVTLPASFQSTVAQKRHLILFAQEPGLGRVLGTAVSPL